MESLTGLDAAFLSFETPNAPLHVGAVIVFDPPPGKQLLFSEAARFGFARRLIEQRIHLVPPFRRRAVGVPFGLGQPVWIEDPELDLDAHVRRARLPTPGGMAELTEFVADLLARPLDRSRPLWEMVITEGLEGGRSALIVKMHHAILDGVSAASLLGTFLDLGPRPRAIEPPEATWEARARADGYVARETRARGGRTRAWPRIGDDQSISSYRDRARGASSAARVRWIRAGAITVCGSQNVAERRTVLTPEVRDGERLVVGGQACRPSIRRNRQRRHADLRRRGASEPLRRAGEEIDAPLVAMVPVSTRERDRGAPAIANEPTTLGNKVSAMLVSLATTIDDPVERLNAVAESGRSAKTRTDVLGGRIIDDWAQLIVPAVSTRAARLLSNLRVFDRVAPAFNVIISNVPGPQFDLWFGGCRIDALYPIGPLVEGIGLNITALSYMGGLHIGMLACRRLVPDLDSMPTLIESRIEELVSAVPAITLDAG